MTKNTSGTKSYMIVAILLCFVAGYCILTAAGNMQVEKQPACLPYFFEGVGDLNGDCYESICTDISGDGVRVVGSSYADDPLIPNDGKTCQPDGSYGPRPHSNQAFGWTRPCSFLKYYPPPVNGSGGMIGFGYGTSGIAAKDAESYAYGISPDGKLAVGYTNYDSADNSTAVIFLPGKRAEALSRILITSIALDISQSGAVAPNMFNGSPADVALLSSRVVVGYTMSGRGEPIKEAGAKAVYWDSWTHIVPLPLPVTLPNGAPVVSSEANCISDDGMIIGGNLYYDVRFNPTHFMSFPCIWKFNPGLQKYILYVLRDFTGGHDNAQVTHISGNGRILVGRGNIFGGHSSCYNYPAVACLWNLDELNPGLPVKPKVLSSLRNRHFNISYALGTNYDGSSIVGVCQYATCDYNVYHNSPVIWNTKIFPAPPREIKKLLGNKVPGDWDLQWANRVSNNGKIVIGYGFNSRGGEGWVAGIP